MLEGRRVSGDKIRQARLRAGMTQTELARAINVSERNVVRWETGRNQPRPDYVFAIADACRCHVADLYDGDCDPDLPMVREARLTREEAQEFFALLGKALGVEVLA